MIRRLSFTVFGLWGPGGGLDFPVQCGRTQSVSRVMFHEEAETAELTVQEEERRTLLQLGNLTRQLIQTPAIS